MIIGVTKLAEELGVTRQTIYRYIKDGMPVFSNGGTGRLVFELEDVKKWLRGEK